MRSTVRFLTVAVLILAGCGAGGDAGSDDGAASETVDQAGGDDETLDLEGDPPPLDRDALVGGSWTLRFGGGPDGEVILVDGWPITITFDDETFGGRAACNGYGGTYRIDGDKISFSDMGVTSMACQPEVLAAEQAYLAALNDVTGINLVPSGTGDEGWELALSGPASELIFTSVAAAPMEALVDTLWLLELVIEGGEATPAQGQPATLRLDADGTVVGGTGCRSLTGTYIVTGAQVLFNNFAADGDCPTSLSRQDNQVVTVLGDGFEAQIEDGADGAILMVTSVGNEALQYRASNEEEVAAMEDTPSNPAPSNPAPSNAAPSDAELLDGIEWVFVGGDGPDGAITDPTALGAEPFTLVLTMDGYHGRAICNNYRGPAEVGDGRVSFGMAASTRMSCGEGLDQLAGTILNALAGMVEFGIEDDGMVLVMNDGSTELIFGRANP